MSPFQADEAHAGFAELCRSLLEIGATVWLQAAVVILIGLAAGALLRRRGPAVQSLVYKTTLLAVAACILVTVGFGGYRAARYRFTLPESRMEQASSSFSLLFGGPDQDATPETASPTSDTTTSTRAAFQTDFAGRCY